MKTIRQYLQEAGLSEEDIASIEARESMTHGWESDFPEKWQWDRDIIEAVIADYENPETAARRAKRSGQGVERAAKLHKARKAWLADQK